MDYINAFLMGALATALVMIMRKVLEKAIGSVFGLVPIGIRRFYQYPRWQKLYCDMLVREHRYLRFVGVRHHASLRRPKLADVYVNLELQVAMWVARSESTGGTLGLGQTYGLDTAIETYRHLVILGSPGSGKTTLLEHLVRVYGGAADRTVIRPLPIYIPLRRCTFRGKSLIEQLVDPASSLVDPELLRNYPTGFFESQLILGRCILLFDGLDEVLNEDEHVAAARMVNTIAVLYSKCMIIVTSRLAGWRNLLSQDFSTLKAVEKSNHCRINDLWRLPADGRLQSPCFFRGRTQRLLGNPSLLVIRDLSRKEVGGLIQQWHRAVIRGEHEIEGSANLTDEQEAKAVLEADNRSNRMLNALKNTPSLMQIASTPLILSLMCLVFFTRQDLPRRRAKLYEECATILLGEWDKLDKQMQHIESLQLDDKIRLMEAIACHLFDNKMSELSKRNLEHVILGTLTGNKQTPTAAIRLIEERSGLLSEKAFDTYGFTHLTFQEYFAAKAMAAATDGISRILEHHKVTESEEVLLLYSGIVPDATPLIAALLQQHESGFGVHMLITAGKATVEAVNVDLQARSNVIMSLNNQFESATDQAILIRIQSILSDLGIDRQIVRLFDNYDIYNELGRGSIGTVYRALDRVKNITVAIKIFSSATELKIQSIIKGIKQLLGLKHPNLITFIDIGKQRDQMFVAMEYIAGYSLDESFDVPNPMRDARTVLAPRRGPDLDLSYITGGHPGLKTLTLAPPKQELPADGLPSAGPQYRQVDSQEPAEKSGAEPISAVPPKKASATALPGLLGATEPTVSLTLTGNMGGDVGPLRIDSRKIGTDWYYSWVKLLLHDILAGVGYLHQQGIIHGDIKPSNIMWNGKNALVGDYGIDNLVITIQQAVSRQQPANPKVLLAYTPGYAAPEVREASHFHIQSDIYSIGCVLADFCGYRQDYHRGRGSQLSMINIDPSEDAMAIIRTALDDNPSNRYATCRDMWLALQSANLMPNIAHGVNK